MYGQLSVIKALHANGAELNAPDRKGWTPLMCAASQGQYGAASALLDLGADPVAGRDVTVKTVANERFE